MLRIIGSTAGRQKFSGAPWSSRSTGLAGVPVTRMWWSPRARWTRPATTGMPSVASTQSHPVDLLMCSARMVVKVGGMCCVSRIGSPRVFGSSPNSLNSACGPPVELPIATTRGISRPIGRNVTAVAAAAGAAATGAGVAAARRSAENARLPGSRSPRRFRRWVPNALTLADSSRLKASALVSSRVLEGFGM